MANTYVDYTATASQTDFAFSFDYLEDEHVTVSIDGVATTDFTIVTTPSTKIVLDTGATAGQVVRVARYSQPDQNLVDFVNGSVLTESELDRAYLHNRYLAEESAEQNDVSLRVKEGAAGWDGLNKRLLNLANPVDDQDAATKDYVDDVIGSVAVGTLPDDSVTYAKIQDVAANNVLLGNDNGTNQNVQELTAAEVRTVLNVADGANNYTHPNHTGDVTSTGDGATVITDNAVTSAKISDTDTQFLVDDTSTQKKVVINDDNADVDFTVKANTSGTLINADAGTGVVDVANTTMVNSLAIYNPSGSPTAVEGGQIYLNKSTQSSGIFSEVVSFSLDAYKDVLNSYQHGVDAQLFRIIQTTAGATTSFAENGDISFSGNLFPILNGAYDLGTSSLKWQDVYSTTGAFNGSDANLKQDIEELSEAEKRVAVAAKGLLKKYRLKQAVQEKGENARYHFGIVAQELQAAFEAEGLDPMKYGIIAVNTWYEKTEDGKRYVSKTQEQGYQQVTEMSVRYSELLAFIIAAL